MEKTEMMKRYEADTGVVLNIDHLSADANGYIEELEAELRGLTMLYKWAKEEITQYQAKAAAYDRLMSGGVKTPKEVANFLDLPIAQDKEGFWHSFGSPPVIDEFRGTWGSFLGYEKEIPSCNIRYTGDWKDSLTLPDRWEAQKC